VLNAAARHGDRRADDLYLTSLADFPVVNQVYAEFFAPPCPPARRCQVAALPRNARVEIDAIAVASD